MYGTQSDLISRIRYNVANKEESRPIALLVGSGLTASAVPDVNKIVLQIRKAIEETDRIDFDEEINRQEGSGRKYQAAFSFLSRRMPPAIADRLITAATLQAYPPAKNLQSRLSSTELAAAEKNCDAWSLPRGVESLGRIWAGLPVDIRGPIITTNFDPLIEIAIQKAGAPVIPRVMDADGTFIHDISLIDIAQVVHLHGFWRESQTLHMTTQLTVPRPSLAGSLRVLLSRYTLVVLGYSGWQDAVMTQLEVMINENAARDLDVLWCNYGNVESLESEMAKNSAIRNLTRGMGNVQFYTDIDVNTALPALEEAIADSLNYDVSSLRPKGSGSLLGWTPVTKEGGKAQSAESARARAVDYFDGRVPTLRDGYNQFIPQRDVVNTVINELRSNALKRSNSLTLLSGASGEGKSTALIQAAAQAASIAELGSIWIHLSGRIDSITDIISLPLDQGPVVLFLDEAQESISELKELVSRINAGGQENLHFVLAVRDTDWNAVGGSSFAWQNYISYRKHPIRGISRPDARSLVMAWEILGAGVLGNLVHHPDTEARMTALLEAGHDNGSNKDGTLFGAMLAMRYGDGLVSHIRDLLLRLKDRIFFSPRLDRNISLAEAFLSIAIAHSVRANALDHAFLAELFGVSRSELEMNVLGPLGEESPIALEGRTVMTRHHAIAQSAVSLIEELGFEATSLYSRLVRVAVRGIEVHGIDGNLLGLAYISQQIDDSALRIATALAASEEAPDRLSYRSSLSRAYRSSSRADLGSMVGLESVEAFSFASDRSTGVRISLTEWGVCEGQQGEYATNAFLAGLALSDLSPDLDIFSDRIEGTVSCLGIAFEKLWRETSDYNYVVGLAGVCFVGRSVRPRDWSRFEDWERLCGQAGAPDLASPESAVQSIQRAVQVARARTRGEVVRSVSSYSLVFGKLRRCLERRVVG